MSNTNTPSNTTPAGTTPTHAIPLSPEEEDVAFTVFQDIDSDSEGGMQLDPPDPNHTNTEPALLEFASGELAHVTPAWEEQREATLLSNVAPNPTHHGVEPRLTGRVARPRHRLREEEHAALAVLDDWELLVSYAVKNGLTIPQTRRRFTAKLLAPDNPPLEEELYGARFVVPASESELLPSFLEGAGGRQPEQATGTGDAMAYLVPGTWKEVVTDGEEGWWGVGRGPKGRKVSGGRNGGLRGVVSGMSSSV